MKKALIPFLSILFYSASLHAQEAIVPQPCENADISRQADSLKQMYSKDGFQLLKEASITMESEYEMPVIVPLQEGSLYQIVFIGDYSSKLYEVRMYDWDEKMVVYQKKMWGDIDGNIITFSYIPKFSEYHMIKPVQINKQKKKKVCGYVMLLKKLPATR
jgi:hypothetical protein